MQTVGLMAPPISMGASSAKAMRSPSVLLNRTGPVHIWNLPPLAPSSRRIYQSAQGSGSGRSITGRSRGADGNLEGGVRCRSSSSPSALPPNENETFLEAARNAYGRFMGLANKFMPVSGRIFFTGTACSFCADMRTQHQYAHTSAAHGYAFISKSVVRHWTQAAHSM